MSEALIRRRRRTRILAKSSPALARELAALVERAATVEVLQAPRQGLVMCQVRETARNSRFYLGEALMSECRVRVGETEGLGVVLGPNAELAHDMAVVDAALSAPEPSEVADELERRLLAAERDLERAQAERDARVLASRVSFDTMGGQDMSVQAVVK